MQGFSEDHLLEKFSRDSKILDIFEGTQQIQQLIVARQVLKKALQILSNNCLYSSNLSINNLRSNKLHFR